MKAVSIGSFEAKTHFSRLLREVQRGVSFEILHRGKPVARLVSLDSGDRLADIDAVLAHGRQARAGAPRAGLAEISAWKVEGRG